MAAGRAARRGERRAGLADLALVPALVWGWPRWLWAVVRTAQTLAFARRSVGPPVPNAGAPGAPRPPAPARRPRRRRRPPASRHKRSLSRKAQVPAGPGASTRHLLAPLGTVEGAHHSRAGPRSAETARIRYGWQRPAAQGDSRRPEDVRQRSWCAGSLPLQRRSGPLGLKCHAPSTGSHGRVRLGGGDKWSRPERSVRSPGAQDYRPAGSAPPPAPGRPERSRCRHDPPDGPGSPRRPHALPWPPGLGAEKQELSVPTVAAGRRLGTIPTAAGCLLHTCRAEQPGRGLLLAGLTPSSGRRACARIPNFLVAVPV